MPIRPVTDPSVLQQLNAGGVQNPMFPGQLQGQGLSNQEKAATLPYAAPKAAADVGKTVVDTRTVTAGLPYVAPKAAADVRSAEANATIAEHKAAEEKIAAAKLDLEKFGGEEQVNQLINAVEKAKSLVNGWTTGAGSFFLKNLPATQARTLNNVITQEVRGNVFLQRLAAMKEENPSPNGGTGIGRIMQAEIPMITGASGALDPEMKGSDLLQSLNQIEHGALRVKARVNGQNPDDVHAITAMLASAQKSNGPGAGGGDNGAPHIGPAAPPGGPHADYSGMVGGPQAELAQTDPTSKLGAFKQTYRREFDPAMANVIGSFIRKGVPFNTAANYAQSHGFNPMDEDTYNQAVQYAREHRGAVNVDANRSVPTTLGERLSSSPAAATLAGVVSGGTAGLSDVAGRALAGPEWDANRAALSATHHGYDLGGNVAGGAAGMFAGGSGLGNLLSAGAKGGLARNSLALASKNPIMAGILGDTAYSTTYGASENPDNPLAGAGIGALVGPLASGGGQLLAKAAGSVLRGVADPAVQRLQQAGIPLTVGEILGGGSKKAQDALTSVFGPGNMVSRRYAEGRQALNKAAFNQAGQTIGAPINEVGQAGINALDTAKNQAYSKALDPVSINLNDPNFVQTMQGAINAADQIPGAELPEGYGGVSIRHYVGNHVASDGTMTGPQFQAAYRGLAQTANKAAPKIEGHDIGQAIRQAKGALTTALQDQNPGAYEGFLKANAANRQLNILADAVNSAKNQVGDGGEPLFTPAQLGTSATANAKKYGGNINAAAGNRPFNQLATDAQKVMSSKLPESGTFPRALLAGILTGGIMGGGGAAGGYANGGEGAAAGALAPLTLLSLLGTRRGQKLLAGALTNRTAADQLTGRMLLRHPQAGGDILTAAGIPLLAGP